MVVYDISHREENNHKITTRMQTKEHTKDEKMIIVGFGWIGQANALSLLKMGYPVFFYDPAPSLTFHYVKDGESYDGIERIDSLTSEDSANTCYIVCVGDRVSEEREQDISPIKNATDALKDILGTVIVRSTILPQKLKELHFDFYVPEFLHEKNAIDECLNPHFFVLGTRNEKKSVPTFLKQWEQRSYRVFKGTPEEASYIKYLSNLWNTVRIAFVNEFGDSMGNPKTKEDIHAIERVLDFVLERKSYVRYGQAFDGHCLPKDTRAFIGAHAKEGKNVDLLVGAYTSNEHHKKIQEQYKTLPKVFSFWEYDKKFDSALGFVWRRINETPSIKGLRKKSRFIVDALNQVIPDRTIEQSALIWEKKARENPLYYSFERTKAGRDATDDDMRQSGKIDFERYILEDPAFRELLDRASSARALDFGSGVGRMTEFFGEHFGEVYGADISKTMIEHATERVKLPHVRFNVVNGHQLPYEDKYFDVIFSYLALQHVPTGESIERYLEEFNRILKKDGLAKLQFRAGRGVKKWAWSYGVSFTPEEIIACVERHGFTVLDHQVEEGKHLWVILQT